jgi:cell division septum initiation protein DivIVA
VSITDDPFEEPGEEAAESGGAEQAAGSSPYTAHETEALLGRLIEVIESARPMPLSNSSMINKDEVLDIIDAAIARLPDELRAARWLLKERDDFLAKIRREGDDILEQARSSSEKMVQRTEVVKAAEQRARQIVDAAEAEARRMRHETEDFCDQKLAGFEIVLERTTKLVNAGRSKLQAMPTDVGDVDDETEIGELGELGDLFDQDEP